MMIWLKMGMFKIVAKSTCMDFIRSCSSCIWKHHNWWIVMCNGIKCCCSNAVGSLHPCQESKHILVIHNKSSDFAHILENYCLWKSDMSWESRSHTHMLMTPASLVKKLISNSNVLAVLWEELNSFSFVWWTWFLMKLLNYIITYKKTFEKIIPKAVPRRVD